MDLPHVHSMTVRRLLLPRLLRDHQIPSLSSHSSALTPARQVSTHVNMGGRSSAEQNIVITEDETPNDFHVLEVHSPSAGAGFLGFIVTLSIAMAAYQLYRYYKRRQFLHHERQAQRYAHAHGISLQGPTTHSAMSPPAAAPIPAPRSDGSLLPALRELLNVSNRDPSASKGIP